VLLSRVAKVSLFGMGSMRTFVRDGLLDRSRCVSWRKPITSASLLTVTLAGGEAWEAA
jgi:hypothetical protein